MAKRRRKGLSLQSFFRPRALLSLVAYNRRPDSRNGAKGSEQETKRTMWVGVGRVGDLSLCLSFFLLCLRDTLHYLNA